MQVVVLFLVVSTVVGARSANGKAPSRKVALVLAVLAAGMLFNYRFV